MSKKHGKVLGCPVCSVGSEVSTQEIDVGAKVREIISPQAPVSTNPRFATRWPRVPSSRAIRSQKAQAFACLIEGAVTRPAS